MKKLGITKEQFAKSKYFQNKYGKLEYVSESGKIYKTSKGNLLKFNEGILDFFKGKKDKGGSGHRCRDFNPGDKVRLVNPKKFNARGDRKFYFDTWEVVEPDDHGEVFLRSADGHEACFDPNEVEFADKSSMAAESEGQTYTVHYSFYLSDSIEVEAASEKEAEAKVQEMIENGEIGNLNEMEIGDSEIWVD